MDGLFFGAPFFLRPFFWVHFCFSAGKKERSNVYVERAGPQAPKGVLGCNTLSPKRSAGLQNPKALIGVLGCNTLSPKRSALVQNPKALKGMSGCKTLNSAAILVFLADASYPQKKGTDKKEKRALKKNSTRN